jgi:hypothetical protein
MSRVVEEEVEQLLRAEYRARLPFWRLATLYLDPFSLFKDASRGTDHARASARRYNRALRWVLVPYLLRWLWIASALLAAVMPAERYTAFAPALKIPAAACAVGSCIAIAVMVWTAIAWLLLATQDP